MPIHGYSFPIGPTFDYAPRLSEIYKEIRATATYIDRRGVGKTAESKPTAAVTADVVPNVPPRFVVYTTGYTIEEGPAGRLVDKRLSGSDRDGDTLTFGIVEGEEDAGLFELDATTGQLTVLQELDYESSTKALRFTATLHDGKGLDTDNNVINDDTVDVTKRFQVSVIDVEEEGMVTLSNPAPGVGVNLEATLTDGDGIIYTDGDGNIYTKSWQWARSSNGSMNWVYISGETSSSYTTVRADENFFLRASVLYQDNRGSKYAEAVTSRQVYSDNRRPLFPSTETGQRVVPENTRAGVNIGAPAAAVDPENDRLTYSLSGTDAAAFTIVTSTGQLRTKDALDFETKSGYSLTVEVHDGRDDLGNPSTTVDDTQSLTITVENVEEPGSVRLSTLTGTVQALVEVTATLSDDDGPTKILWSWWRSPDGRTDWVKVADETSETPDTYTPTPGEDAGNYIRATASYTDGHGPNKTKTATVVSPRVGDPPPVNSAPVFPSTENGQREVVENATGEYPIGDPVFANDFDDDALTYSLSGTDRASFTIDANTGQLRLAWGVKLDYEGKRSYRVTVEVTDGRNQNGAPDNGVIDDTINVVITVTDVNEAPVVTGDASPSFRENETSVVASYAGADPEGDTLTWSVSLSYAYGISERGQLYFLEPPTFEAEFPFYAVTVFATDEGNLRGSLDVTVNLTDVEEEGKVTITPPRGWVNPRTQFSAKLVDDDGGITGETWKWERSSNRSSWIVITGAMSSVYRARADDANHYLRATVSYEDRRGNKKTASAELTLRIGDTQPATNSAPEFPDITTTRTISQGTAAGRNVGLPVQATDADDDEVLTYSLTGSATAKFDIDPATGQIRTRAVLDPDVPDTYTGTVSVHDWFDDNYKPSTAIDASIDVTITVTAPPPRPRRRRRRRRRRRTSSDPEPAPQVHRRQYDKPVGGGGLRIRREYRQTGSGQRRRWRHP